MQDARSIGADLDARTDLAQRLRALIDMNIRARTQQRQRRGETADTAAYDRYGEFIALHAIASARSVLHHPGNRDAAG